MGNSVSADFDVSRVRKIIGVVIHNAYKTLKGLNVDIKELQGDFWLKAWKATISWDKAKAANQYTFIQTACEREVIARIREAARNARKMPMASIGFGSEEQRESLDDILSDPDADVLSVVNVTLTIEKARKSLRANDRTLFELLLDGKTQDEMAKELGCTQPSISLRLSALRKQLQWMKADLSC